MAFGQVALPLDSHDLHKLDEKKADRILFVTLTANLGGVDVENNLICVFICE